jgi:hypothetical protein
MQKPRVGVFLPGEQPGIIYRNRLPERKEYECLVSICAHDSEECLLDMIHNLCYALPQSILVININSRSYQLDENQLPENVWISRQNVITFTEVIKEPYTCYYLLDAFVNNIQFIKPYVSYKRILFVSSSCLMFRQIDWSQMEEKTCHHGVIPTFLQPLPSTIPTILSTESIQTLERNPNPYFGRLKNHTILMDFFHQRGYTEVASTYIHGALVPYEIGDVLLDLHALLTQDENMKYNEHLSYEEFIGHTVILNEARIRGWKRTYGIVHIPNLVIAYEEARKHGWSVSRELLYGQQHISEYYLYKHLHVIDYAASIPGIYGCCKIVHEIEDPARKRIRQMLFSSTQKNEKHYNESRI